MCCSTQFEGLRPVPRDRRALLVCLTGVDGSGKTTQARRLVDCLSDMGIPAAYLWNRWEPRLLAPLKRMFRGRRSRSLNGRAEHLVARVGEAPESRERKRRLLAYRPIAWAWLSLAYGDYLLQAWRRLRTPLRSARVVVCDRYLIDFQVDQAVNLGGSVGDLERVRGMLVARLFPQSTSAFVLTIDPQVCVGRKWDGLSVDRIAARQELYQHFADTGLAQAVSSDTDENAVATELLRRVLLSIQEVM
jgi:thymidylate kinase